MRIIAAVSVAAALAGCAGPPARYGITGPGTGPDTTPGLAAGPRATIAAGEQGTAVGSVIQPAGLPANAAGTADPDDPAASPTYIGNGRYFDYN